MADLITISDQASKSIKEQLFPTLQENFLRTSNHPMLKMYGFESKAVDQKGGVANRPRVMPVGTISAGRDIEILHEHSLFGGGYGVAEDTSLKYGKRAEARSKATIRFYEGAFKVSRQDIAATRDSDKAVVEVVSRHATNAMRQAQKDVGRQVTYKASSILATVNGAVTASTVVAVDNDGTSESRPTRYLRPTLKVWIGTTAAIEAGTADSHEISSVTSSTGIVLTGAGTFADDDDIVAEDVYSGGAYREFETLDNLIAATGTVQNVNKGTNDWFASYVAGSVGTLAISDIDTMVVDIREFADDPSKAFLQANATNWRRYADLLTANKRHFTTDKLFDGIVAGGATQLSYFAPDGQFPVYLCNDVPDGYIYAVDAEGYKWAEMQPLSFTEDALSMNGTPGQRISGSTNYEFAFMLYGQQVQMNAKSSGKLTGITA